MTLMDLQDSLCARLEHVFRNVRLMAKGGEYVPVRINKQIIPFIDYADQEDGLERRAPCCSVFIADVRTNLYERGEPAYPSDEVTAFLCFVTYDNGKDGQGHRDMMMLYELVKQHFRANPVLSPEFYCRREMSFSLDAREEAPIFSSAMGLEFDMRVEEAESKYI